jgi:hypothetical protein
VSSKLTRQDVILDSKNAYFSVLKNQKLLEVAHQTVTSINSQKEVSENFYKVGLSPLNDLLQSQVQLANAKQQLTTAQNNLEISRANFNTVLRRQVNTPVLLVEEVDYSMFQEALDDCLAQAQNNRLEIQVADLDINIAEKQVKLTEKDYYPSVNFTGAYARTGDDLQAHGGEGITDSAGWNVQATATWDFWQWGRTGYGRKEKLAGPIQVPKTEITDNINLEVKQAICAPGGRAEHPHHRKAVEQPGEPADHRRAIQSRWQPRPTCWWPRPCSPRPRRTITTPCTISRSQAVLMRAIGRETIE